MVMGPHGLPARYGDDLRSAVRNFLKENPDVNFISYIETRKTPDGPKPFGKVVTVRNPDTLAGMKRDALDDAFG